METEKLCEPRAAHLPGAGTAVHAAAFDVFRGDVSHRDGSVQPQSDVRGEGRRAQKATERDRHEKAAEKKKSKRKAKAVRRQTL